jgi:thiol-disulfide isomerase/thioredoxin
MHVVLTMMVALAAASAGQVELGSKVEKLSVQDLSGQAVEMRMAGKVTVVLFVSVQCPVSNAYNERMSALYNDYAGKGVQFVFVNSNSTEAAAAVGKHASDQGFKFKVYKDEGNVVADQLGGQVTPHVFVFDQGGVLQYRGAIDDAQAVANVKKTPARDALNALLAGQKPAVAEVKAFGCSIKRMKKAS